MNNELTADNQSDTDSAQEATEAALRGDAAAMNETTQKTETDSGRNGENINAEAVADRKPEQTKAFAARLKARSLELENKYLGEISARDGQLEKLKREYDDNSAAIESARRIIAENTIKADIEAIKKVYPDAKIENAEDIGEIYIKLMSTAEVDSLTAYEAQLIHDKRLASAAPASMGDVKAASQSAEKEYYSPEEVDRLSESDFERDPSLWGKVRKSMLKWYK